jgi:outer membrane protein assembly factor BamA
LRVIGQGAASVYVDDTLNRRFAVGGDDGLRGYAIGQFFGNASALGHVEVRSMAVSVASLRLGGLVFYDVGDAASPNQGTGNGLDRAIRALRRLYPYQDVGFGARLLIPQLNAYVLRFDLAFPTEPAPHTRAWGPRFTSGFFQTF